MIAYKTFAECPAQERPLGVLLTYPWQVEPANETSVERGFTVTAPEDFDALLAAMASPNAMSMLSAQIQAKLSYYQSLAPALLKQLYAENTLAGITTVQSNQMFDDYADVVIRLTEGAFPTAIARLQEKGPSGFVTQTLIDNWIIKIQAAMT
jgi:hypothetical protein